MAVEVENYLQGIILYCLRLGKQAVCVTRCSRGGDHDIRSNRRTLKNKNKKKAISRLAFGS